MLFTYISSNSLAIKICKYFNVRRIQNEFRHNYHTIKLNNMDRLNSEVLENELRLRDLEDSDNEFLDQEEESTEEDTSRLLFF